MYVYVTNALHLTMLYIFHHIQPELPDRVAESIRALTGFLCGTNDLPNLILVIT